MPTLLLFVSTSLGCPIMDELNAANEKMAAFSETQETEEEGAVNGEDPATVAKKKIEKWWGQAKSLSSQELSPAIVSCRLNTGTQFMTRDECLSRGGQPSRASG